MFIFFDKLEVDYMLLSEAPENENSSTSITDAQKLEVEEKLKKFEKDNNMVIGHLLLRMINTLFDLFSIY